MFLILLVVLSGGFEHPLADSAIRGASELTAKTPQGTPVHLVGTIRAIKTEPTTETTEIVLEMSDRRAVSIMVQSGVLLQLARVNIVIHSYCYLLTWQKTSKVCLDLPLARQRFGNVHPIPTSP